MMQEELVIHKIFSETAKGFPEKIALQAKDERYTYKEVESQALRIGAFLIEQEYKRGDCAALILENCPEWGIIYLGIIYAGLTCVGIDSELTSADLDNIFQDCCPVIVFTSNKIHQEKIAQLKYQSLKVLTIESGDFKNIRTQDAQGINLPDVSSSDAASLIYTSGTTAKPKGVILTHYNFCANVRSIEKINICSSKDNFLSILPLYHTYAFMTTLLLPLLIGARVTYAGSFKPEDLVGIIKGADVTILVGVPQLFSLIHKAIFEKIKGIPSLLRILIMPLIKQGLRRSFGRGLRLLISGGARLEPRVGRGLTKLGFKVIEGYGLTETSPVVTFNPPERVRFGSVGKPLPDVRIRIDHPDNSGVGEVFIKGPNVMSGYFKQPDLTAQVKSKDGWFNSQDLGYLDKDGYLFLTGRKKDVIVLSSGKNIYPQELEEYYNQCPYIKELCILEKRQKQFDQDVGRLFAVIVPDFEYFRNKREVNIRERIRWELENLSSKLPGYERIMGFAVTSVDLPRTRLRKIKRYEVSRIYLGQIPQAPLETEFLTGQEEIRQPGLSPEDKAILDSEISQRIIKYLSSQLNKRVNLNSHLELDLGIDSLGRVELGAGLESLLSIKIPEDIIDNTSIVKELIMNIQRITGAPGGIRQSKETQRRLPWGEILNQTPPPGVLGRIKVNYGFLDKLLTWIFKKFFEFTFRLFYSLRVEGREFIPLDGPYVFCPNHASYLDGFVLFASVPSRCAVNLFFIGHAKIFEHSLINWAVKIARLISIDPVAHLTEALQAARFVLRNKKLICIFPEGGRSIDSNIQDFKKGIGILAKELNIPLIPVYIRGSHFIWPRTKRLPRIYPLRVIFGKPVLGQELGNDYGTITKGLRGEVLKLRDDYTDF